MKFSYKWPAQVENFHIQAKQTRQKWSIKLRLVFITDNTINIKMVNVTYV